MSGRNPPPHDGADDSSGSEDSWYGYRVPGSGSASDSPQGAADVFGPRNVKDTRNSAAGARNGARPGARGTPDRPRRTGGRTESPSGSSSGSSSGGSSSGDARPRHRRREGSGQPKPKTESTAKSRWRRLRKGGDQADRPEAAGGGSRSRGKRGGQGEARSGDRDSAARLPTRTDRSTSPRRESRSRDGNRDSTDQARPGTARNRTGGGADQPEFAPGDRGYHVRPPSNAGKAGSTPRERPFDDRPPTQSAPADPWPDQRPSYDRPPAGDDRSGRGSAEPRDYQPASFGQTGPQPRVDPSPAAETSFPEPGTAEFYVPDQGVPDPYTAPPLAPDPYGAAIPTGPDDQPRSLPAPEQSNATLWTGLVVGAVTLIVLVTVAVVVLYQSPPERRIIRAQAAGGMQLDEQGVSFYSRFFDPYRQIIEDGTHNRIGAAGIVTAVYDAGRDPTTGQRKHILFIGASGDLGDPDTTLQDFQILQEKRNNLEVVQTEPGPGGGDAICMQVRAKSPQAKTAAGCMWLTENSLGFVVPTTPNTTGTVAQLMRKMRPDLEKES